MQNAEDIRRFTRGVAILRDPPMLPMALWFGTIPALTVWGTVHPLWVPVSFVAALLATALGSRWFRQAYGVVRPSADSVAGRAAGAIVLIGVVLALEGVSIAAGLPVGLGLIVFGIWLIWSARTSEGLRRHLYVLGTVCIGIAFVPLVIGPTLRANSTIGGTIKVTAFGLGWAYVCIQDYRALRRSRPASQTGA
jgi:hypothetical protein